MFNNVQPCSRTEASVSDVHRHRVHKRNPVIVDDVHVRRQQLHVPVKVQNLLQQVVCTAWKSRMETLPLVVWRPREYNELADALANTAMDEEKSVIIASDSRHNLQDGVLLQ